MDKCLIIDGLNYIYRAKTYEAMQLGPYGVVFCFFKNLRALVEQFPSDKIFFVKEGKNNFRYSIYSDYKANRRIIKQGSFIPSQEQDESFNHQRDIIFRLIPNLPINIITADGVEGDDTIRSLVDNLRSEEIIIVSNDSDILQVLQQGYKNVRLYDPFKKKFLVAPVYMQMVFKSLFGDKSDNIPQLLPKMKAIDLASNPQKLSEFLSIEENRANFQINRQLVELKRVPDSELMVEDYRVDFEYLRMEFKEMEFASLLRYEYWQKFKKTFSSVRL